MKKTVAFLVLIASIEIALTCLLPFTREIFYNALDAKLQNTLLFVGFLFLNAFALDMAQALKGYLVNLTGLIKRGKTFIKLANDDLKALEDRPQRLQEDIKLSFIYRYTVLIEYFISGGILLFLIFSNLHQPMLVAGALTYAIITVLLALLFGKKLVKAEANVQSQEAAFRISLASTVNALGLHSAQKASIGAAKTRLAYAAFTRAQNAVLIILPFLVLLPGYLTGDVTLGYLMKSVAVFDLLVVNANILINMYPTWCQSLACRKRVQELID